MARVKLAHKPRVQKPENRSTERKDDGSWKRAGDLKPGDTLVFAVGVRRHHWQVVGLVRHGLEVQVIGDPMGAKTAPVWTYDRLARVQVLAPGEFPRCV